MISGIAAVLIVAVVGGLVQTERTRRRQTGALVAALRAPDRSTPTDPTDPTGRLVAALRARPWARRGLSLLSIGLLLGAVGVLGYPLYTNMYQDRVQSRLGGELASPSPELEQAFRADTVVEGDPLTRIIIDAIDVSEVVVEGTTASALRAGSGHYPQTPLPCAPGNVAIAGHRTTYGRPFHNLDRMKVGDMITLQTPVGSCTYVVDAAPFAVSPTEVSIVADKGRDMLTLTTCHPKGSAAQRLIVTATLQGPATAT